MFPLDIPMAGTSPLWHGQHTPTPTFTLPSELCCVMLPAWFALNVTVLLICEAFVESNPGRSELYGRGRVANRKVGSPAGLWKSRYHKKARVWVVSVVWWCQRRSCRGCSLFPAAWTDAAVLEASFYFLLAQTGSDAGCGEIARSPTAATARTHRQGLKQDIELD